MPSINHKNNENSSNFEDRFSLILKYPLVSLLFVGISAISIRLIFFQNELIFTSDNLSYFNYAIDVSLTGKLPTTFSLPNNGWPLLLSIFFKISDSENFYHYMNFQSILSIIFSTITIIPLYFLAKKFVEPAFAIITIILFVFEPRIIQNSLIGVTDPLFILLIVTSLTLVFQKNKYVVSIAFITVALASIVRAEGLFLIPALCVIFFIRFKITKKSLLQCVIFILISILIISPFVIQRIESSGNDYLVGRIVLASSSFSEQTQNEPTLIFSKIVNSIYIFLEFLGKLMIPYLWVFVPVGIILFFKKNQSKKLLLIIPGFFLILPSLYAYTIPALDSRYLFPILPIFCIFGTFTFMKFVQNTKYKKIISITIIIFIIFSSLLFLIYKNSDDIEKQNKFLELAEIVNSKTDVILYINLSPVLSHLDPAGLIKLEKFPVLSSNYDNDSNIKIVNYTNLEDFFLNIEKNGITHVVIDEEIDNPILIKQVFDNYKEYKNLKKIFDSKENGYDYKIKIFELIQK